METLNLNNENLESSFALNNISRFESFDISKFLEDKILAVEKVQVDTHIKLEIRIVEDNTVYADNDKNLSNTNKIITFIIDDSIAEYINIVNIIGKQVVVGNLSNAEPYIYGVNSLKLVVDDIDILDNKIPDFNQRTKLNKTDYKLVKTNGFKSFDHNKFLSTYKMNILTIYPQSPKVARAIIIITDTHDDTDESRTNIGKTFSIKLEMDEVRDIPLDLLIGNKPFDQSNLVGHISGTVVKNNHVLLMSDALKLHVDDKIITVGSSLLLFSSKTKNTLTINFSRLLAYLYLYLLPYLYFYLPLYLHFYLYLYLLLYLYFYLPLYLHFYLYLYLHFYLYIHLR